MALHNELGEYGEDLACQMYLEKGCWILDRNWSVGDLEIDIIAQEEDVVVFCEVKTRSSNKWGEPEDAVDERRKRRLCVAASAYLKKNQLDNPWRFDVVAITMVNGEPQMKVIEDAFTPRPHYVSSRTGRPESRWHKGRYTRR